MLAPLLAVAALTLAPSPAEALPLASPPGAAPPLVPSSGAALPLRQVVGQRVIASLPGTVVPSALVGEIHRGEVAGVILFSRNIASRAQLRALTAKLQAARQHGPRALRERPLLVMVDQEGGLVKRLPGAPVHSPAQLARIGSTVVAHADGVATARNLRGVGVNVNLAPVLDIGLPGSSVRALGRAYGSTPARVSALGGAFADGLAEGGVLACAKHFPGLGRGTANEDDRLNRIAAPLATLRGVDEMPFRSAATGGIGLVMVSTGVYPALAARPAMFAPQVATTELRGTAGFGGVSITDDLEVPALTRLSPERKALAAARAGDDLLLFAQSAGAADRGAAALVRAVQGGAIARAQIDAGADRVLALRDRLR